MVMETADFEPVLPSLESCYSIIVKSSSTQEHEKSLKNMLTVIMVSVSGFHMMKTAHYTIQENSSEIKLLLPHCR